MEILDEYTVIGLDRDGTINEDIGTYVTKSEQFKSYGSLEAIKLIRARGYDIVIPQPKRAL